MKKSLTDRVSELQRDLGNSENAVPNSNNLERVNRLSDLLSSRQKEKFNYSIEQAVGLPFTRSKHNNPY